MSSNLSGEWVFSEDFGVGYDSGRLKLTDTNGLLEGELAFTETIEGDSPFSILLKIKGTHKGSEVKFKAISISWLKTDEPMTYNLDKWEGIINQQGIIVGHSIDAEGVCGVFTLCRED